MHKLTPFFGGTSLYPYFGTCMAIAFTIILKFEVNYKDILIKFQFFRIIHMKHIPIMISLISFNLSLMWIEAIE